MVHHIQNCIQTHYLFGLYWDIRFPKLSNLHCTHLIVQFQFVIKRNSHRINHNVLSNLFVLKICHNLLNLGNSGLDRPRQQCKRDFGLINCLVRREHIACLVFFYFFADITVSGLHYTFSTDVFLFDLVLDPFFMILQHGTNRPLFFKLDRLCRLVGIERQFIWGIIYLKVDDRSTLFNFLFHLLILSAIS